MRNKIIAGIVLAPLTVLALAACGEVEAPVSDKADNSAPVVEETAEAAETGSEDLPSEDDSTEDTTGETGTATLGDTVEVGDWSVKVTKIAKNANDVIHTVNEFNAQPKGQYVLVTYEATYDGAERTADVDSDLTWTFTGSDNKIHDISYEVTQADDQEWATEARKGGTVKQQALFDLQPGLIAGGILSVEGYDADFDTVFADFAV